MFFDVYLYCGFILLDNEEAVEEANLQIAQVTNNFA